MSKLKVEKTVNGGWPIVRFKDFYEHDCHLQLSSIAGPCCVWLGLDRAEPVRRKAIGWESVILPDEISIPTAMHLSLDQVKSLLPILQRFVETGDISETPRQVDIRKED